MPDPIEIVLYAVGAVALIVAVIAAVAFVWAVVTDRRRRQAGVRPDRNRCHAIGHTRDARTQIYRHQKDGTQAPVAT
jgi:hypothetical protein